MPRSERLFDLRSIDSARGYAPRDDRRCLLDALRAADRIVLTNTRRIQASGPISRAWDRHRRRNGLAPRRDGPCVAVLLDANLRGRPAGHIAAALARRNIPFVFVTGYGREALPESFGQSSMLTKPFTQEQLVEAATQLIQLPTMTVRLRVRTSRLISDKFARSCLHPQSHCELANFGENSSCPRCLVCCGSWS